MLKKHDKVEILGDDRMKEWDTFVKSHSKGSIYHTYNWGNTIRATYGHNPLYFTICDGHGNIKAGLPVFLIKSSLTGKRFSTIPCAQSCIPLVQDSFQFYSLKSVILEYMKRKTIKSWELKVTADFSFENEYNTNCCDDYSTYVLTLNENPSVLFRNLHKSCIQRTIKKAKRNGLVVKRCSDRKELEYFYRLYVAMRKREGLLPQPRKFFLYLWDNIKPEKHIEIFYAVLHGRIISALLLLCYKDTVIYEYGATKHGMQWTGASPFLIWEAINKACIDGYRFFDFGRNSKDDNGLTIFKRRWRAHEVPLKYYSMSIADKMTTLRQNNIAKRIMEMVVRVMPYEVCQFIGKTVYRHLV